MSTKKKHTMDPNLISTKQLYELDHVVNKMKKEGIKTTRDKVKAAVKAVGRSRHLVYAKLRGK